MFWSGNYIMERELTALLKDPNVSLKQVLEAEDVLQECKVDNKGLIQFVTKPEILAELVTLITEEPPPNTELSTQYRHATMACEVLTSQLSMLSDRLSSDSVLMNRLCDFLNRDPPLNPLLASFFSKTVEMLLQRSPKQDWYLYHIVCLRVLDFFRSRTDFLPNLLRHMSTSAIADIFKYFICLDDLFSKAVIEWLEEHQFLESIIQIVCGNYEPEPVLTGRLTPEQTDNGPVDIEKPAESSINSEGSLVDECSVVGDSIHGGIEESEVNHNDCHGSKEVTYVSSCKDPFRLKAVAATSASELLADLILHTYNTDNGECRASTVRWLVSGFQSGSGTASLLSGMFTSPSAHRHTALNAGTHVLLALLTRDRGGEQSDDNFRTAVELSIAPHLPLLHQALLESHERDGVPYVGRGRLSVSRVVSALSASALSDVCVTLVALTTPAVMCDLFFTFTNNSLLHQEVNAMLTRILANEHYRDRYLQHLLVEYDLLTKLMDACEQNEKKRHDGGVIPGNSGHVIEICRRLYASPSVMSVMSAQSPSDTSTQCAMTAVCERWNEFYMTVLGPLTQRYDTPLGGYYSVEQDNDAYDMGLMPDTADYELTDNMENTCDPIEFDVYCRGPSLSTMDAPAPKIVTRTRVLMLAQKFITKTQEAVRERPKTQTKVTKFTKLTDRINPDEWDIDDSPWSPTAECTEQGGAEGEQWANFSDVFTTPLDPFSATHEDNPVSDMEKQLQLVSSDLEHLGFDLTTPPAAIDSSQLANNLRAAISNMAPEDVANLVNSNCEPGDTGDISNAQGNATQESQSNTVEKNTGNLQEKTNEDKNINVLTEKEFITNDNYNQSVDNVSKHIAADEAGNATNDQDNDTDKLENVTDNLKNVTDKLKNVTDNLDNVTEKLDNVTIKEDNVTDKNVNTIDETTSDSGNTKAVVSNKAENEEFKNLDAKMKSDDSEER